ncbi:MAG TPA: hypothetical protein VL460_02140 [Caulobacteraceae bacterium]|nr:hypothetical protein [Caulobacteraceae bacterium]
MSSLIQRPGRHAPALVVCALLAGCGQPKPVATAPEATPVAQPPPAAAPAAAPMKTYASEMRSEDVSITLPPNKSYDSEREHMVQMSAGDTLVYSWTAEGAQPGGEFYYELHGQDPADPEKVIASFEKKMETKGSGAFTVDKPGHYGWFFQNQSDKPVTVKLHIAGFYAPVPAAKS